VGDYGCTGDGVVNMGPEAARRGKNHKALSVVTKSVGPSVTVFEQQRLLLGGKSEFGFRVVRDSSAQGLDPCELKGIPEMYIFLVVCQLKKVGGESLGVATTLAASNIASVVAARLIEHSLGVGGLSGLNL
jgi:hypothetical protein